MRLATWFVLAVSVLAGCARQSSDNAAPATRLATPPSGAQATSPSGVKTVTGTIVETMDAASYTYVRVKTGEGDVWAATAQFKVAPGDRVVVPLEMPMKDFHSASLNRDFPLIYFTSHIDREGQPTPALMVGHDQPVPGPMSGHPPMSGAPPSGEAPMVTKVAPAEGGITIAEVWARRAALTGKTVTVRGKVVKFNGGILDRNWLHIQDGSGDAKDGTNDLTITSQGVAKVGDVITVTGTVATNKDIGSGYSYGVIVESATLVVR
jgi:hypothetical protein